MHKSRTIPVIGLAAAAALLTAFGLLADEVVEGDTLRFDNAVLMLFRDPGAPAVPIGPGWLFEAARDITALGSFSVLGIIVAGIVLQLLLTGAKRTALFVLVSVIGGTVISTGLKALFDRPRPELTGAVEVFTASFPSGHATVSAVVYLTIGAILAERDPRVSVRIFYIAVAALLTFIIGCSRVYLGVHFPTDVLAGWSLGSAWALLCFGVALLLGIDKQPEERPET
jgi:undecaprenyl-diphosphatase